MATSAELLLLLDRRLAVLRTSRPELSDVLDLHEQVIRASLASARPPHAQPFPLPREQVVARLHHGVPLLHDQPAHVDLRAAADLLSRLVNALLQRHDPELQARLELLVDAAASGRLDPERLFAEAFVQHQGHLAELAYQAGVDAQLLGMLSRQAVAPLLRAYAARLLPLIQRVEDDSPDVTLWLQGFCPVCGGWPALGELRATELAQFLRCSACGSAWRSPRVFCPFCANDDARSLCTLSVEGETRFWLSACEHCYGYVKVGNTCDPLPPELLALDDATTQHLDAAAVERGYARPAGTGFTIELAVPEDEWLEELA